MYQQEKTPINDYYKSYPKILSVGSDKTNMVLKFTEKP